MLFQTRPWDWVPPGKIVYYSSHLLENLTLAWKKSRSRWPMEDMKPFWNLGDHQSFLFCFWSFKNTKTVFKVSYLQFFTIGTWNCNPSNSRTMNSQRNTPANQCKHVQETRLRQLPLARRWPLRYFWPSRATRDTGTLKWKKSSTTQWSKRRMLRPSSGRTEKDCKAQCSIGDFYSVQFLYYNIKAFVCVLI